MRGILKLDVLEPEDVKIEKRLALSVLKGAALSCHQVDNATEVKARAFMPLARFLWLFAVFQSSELAL